MWTESKLSKVSSTYRDESGKTWIIQDLVNSNLPYRLLELEVFFLWNRHSCTIPWAGGYTLDQLLRQHETLLQHALRLSWQSLAEQITFKDEVDDHVFRIAAMIRSLGAGWEPPPLVYGLDGKLWDGHHRLCALHYQEIRTHQVLDFSSTST